ncbi:MAG: hypothetical protein K8M05_21280 [Deltaproteobacteria bacterium]|nr:hypothetical protein [Kofleriaceae bacterium]
MASPFTTRAQLGALGFGAGSIRRFENKRTGAISGRSGFRFEDFFATALLIQELAADLSTGTGRFGIGSGGSFVDDVVTRRTAEDSYHQLKTSPRVSWSADMRRDFRAQQKWCTLVGRPHRLILVVPDRRTQARLLAARPAGLRNVEIAQFEQCSSIARLIAHTSVAKDLNSICARTSPNSVDRATIASAVHMWWLDNVKPSQLTPLSKLWRSIRATESLFVRTGASPNAAHWKKTQRILARVPHLTVWLDGGFMQYRYGRTDDGMIGRCDKAPVQRFMRRVIRTRPSTFDEFLEVVP